MKNILASARTRLFAEGTASGIAILVFIAIILYSMAIRIQLFALGISLWYDEGLLAMNIVPKTMAELLTPPLAGMQSAPVGYLAAVKAIVSAFGATEQTMRAYSFIALLGMLLCEWKLLKGAFRLPGVFVWFCLALTATFPLYVRYTNELKPYMGDACIALLVLVLYQLYREKKLPLFALAPICAALILLSSPAVFFVASALLVEFARLLLRKESRGAVLVIAAGLIPAAVFFLNYIFWLRATDAGMFSWWADHKFLLPLSRSAISADLYLSQEFFLPFGAWKTLYLALGAAGFLVSLLKKNACTAIVAVSFALLLGASSQGMYPIISRLWLFFYVFAIMYAVVFAASIRTAGDGEGRVKGPPAVGRGAAGPLRPWQTAAGGASGRGRAHLQTAIAAAVLCAALLAGNHSFPDYAKGEADTLVPGMQLNPLIDYVRSNIQDGEKLYCFETGSSVLGFKNGYGNNRIGNATEDNIIWGAGSFEQIYRPVEEDARLIADAKYAYVMFYRGYLPYSMDVRMPELTRLLSAEGFVDKVIDVNYTPLYWFSKDLAHLKASAEMEALTAADGRPENTLTLRIANTGKTILEAEGADREGAIPLVSGAIKIALRGYKDGVPLPEELVGGLAAPLLPGETADVTIALPGPADADRFEIDLVSEGRFRFSELGMKQVDYSPKSIE
ncbi:MAG: hypothetical protein LBS91_00075 [Clostridiales Family XIII bacterium]|jgi:hypothetical protein|nr:hypothetical protein [Clostridiales Family XIII bacterium]